MIGRKLVQDEFNWMLADYNELKTTHKQLSRMKFVGNKDMFDLCASIEAIEHAMFNRLKNLATGCLHTAETSLFESVKSDRLMGFLAGCRV